MKPVRQLGYRSVQPSSRLAFSLEIPAGPRHHVHRGPAGQQAGDPGRYPARRLGAERAGQDRQEVAHRRRLVIGDVVDPRLAAFDGRDRGRRGIGDVHHRPHPTAAADDREPSLADQLGHDRVRRRLDAGPRAIEATVAKHDAVGPGDAGDRVLQVAQRATGARRPQAGSARSGRSRRRPARQRVPPRRSCSAPRTCGRRRRARRPAGDRCPRCAAGWWRPPSA